MQFRTWPLSALGLGALLLLVAVALAAATGKAQNIYSQLDQLNSYHRNVEGKLRQLREELQISGIFVRDYLLDQDPERSTTYRARIETARTTTQALTRELATLLPASPHAAGQLPTLERQLAEYWRTYDPLFERDPEEDLTESVAFLRSEVLPRRRSALGIAEEIEELNDENLAAQRTQVSLREAELRRDLNRLFWLSLALGFTVAAAVVARLRVVERRAEEQRSVVEEASQAMRQLSQQLVAAQEEERRRISRELHDHVGQMLTALRMELGRIERLRAQSDSRLSDQLAESRGLVDQVVRTVRDLSLGLRPSMLDDLGLQAALEWHVRDFCRRCGIAVDLKVEGNVDHLPDAHSTGIYRLVQEALTNAARHSNATRLDIAVVGSPHAVDIIVRDDGIGFDPAAPRTGIGLRGLEERMRELNGSLIVRTAPGAGTELIGHVPVPSLTREATLATATG